MLFGHSIDSLITARRSSQRQASLAANTMRLLPTSAGMVRVLDTGGDKRPLIITPDGPCVIEHYLTLIELLSADFRVVCFDLPGFGFSYPALRYDFSLVQTSEAILQLLDALNVQQAALAFTCANGFFALYLAKHHAERVSHLILGQTPSLPAMHRWDARIIPKILHTPYIGQLVVAGGTRRFAAKWYNLALPLASPQHPLFVKIADDALRAGGCFCLASFVQGLRTAQARDVGPLATPTLLLHGDHDRSHSTTDFSSLHDHVPAAERVTFSGCGHFPDLERPVEYARQIRRFVASV